MKTSGGIRNLGQESGRFEKSRFSGGSEAEVDHQVFSREFLIRVIHDGISGKERNMTANEI